MAKFKPTLAYFDKEANVYVEGGKETEVTVERATEIQKTLRERAENQEIHESYKDFTMERLDAPKAETKKETKDNGKGAK